MVVSILFLLLLGAVSVVSFVAYSKAKKSEAQQQLPPGYGGDGGFAPVNQLTGPAANAGRQNLMALRLNDIVSYFGQDFVIEGRVEYWEDGYKWLSYMLVDGSDIKWLSVEEDDVLEASMWEVVDDIRLSEPLPEYITYQGMEFAMTERGEARVNQNGHTGNKTGQQVRYFEYEETEEGDLSLSVEVWGRNDIEVSLGQEIYPDSLDILPGDEIGRV